MTAAFGGGELATEWVTILPETATLARKLREFKPAPIKVEVEYDDSDMERQSREGGRRSARSIDREIRRGTAGTGRAVGDDIASGLNTHRVAEAAEATGRTIRKEIENETRKISFKHIAASLFSGFRAGAAATMQIIRNIGSIALVIRVAARAAKAFSLSLLVGATALRAITGKGIARVSMALGFAAHQANRLATQVSRVTSALLVMAATAKFLSFMHSAAKWMGVLTLGSVALLGVASALAVTLGNVVYAALLTVGSAMGIAAGAAAGLLGPALGVVKIAFSGMSDAAKEFNKQFAETDELFNKNIGERMGPLLTAVHDLKLGITDAFTTAFKPAFTWLGGAIHKLQPNIEGLATTMGNLGGEIAGTLNNKVADGTFDRLIDASDTFFQNFLGESGIAGAIGGLIDFATTAATTFSGTGKGINDLLLRFGEFLRGVTGAQMKAVFDTIKQQIKNIWAVLKPVIDTIRQIGAISAPALGPGFIAIGKAIGDAAPGITNMVRILMPALSQVMEKLAPIIPALVQAFTPWAEILAVIAPVAADLITKLAPFAPLLLAVTMAVKALVIGMAIYNTAMLLFTNITKIARAAQWALNAAFVANPIGLIVAAVAAAGVALTLFFTKTETGRKMWDKIWNGMKETAMKVWAWIQVEGPKLWEELKPGLTSLWNTAKEVFTSLKNAFSELWPKIQPVVEWLGKAWFAVQKMNFQNLITGLKVVGAVISWWVDNVVVPGFNLATEVITSWWNAGKSIFNFVADAIQYVSDKITLFGNTWTAVWDGLKIAVQAVWDYLKPVRDWLGDFFDSIGAIGSKAAEAIKSAWSGLTSVLKSPLNALGKFLQGIPGSIMGIDIPFVADLQGWGATLAGLKGGGILRGPGTGTSDSIMAINQNGIPVARVSDGEGVVPKRAMDTPLGARLFNMLLGMQGGGRFNEDMIIDTSRTSVAAPYDPNRITANYLSWMLMGGHNFQEAIGDYDPAKNPIFPGYASGGLIGQFMSSADSAGYQMGGFSMSAFDCSGLVSAMVNTAMGRAWNQGPPGGSPRMATASEAAWLQSQGFQKGAGGSDTLRVGFKNGGAGGGHTAGTLPDGTNFESTSGGVRFGSEAAGASAFPEQWFLPRNGPEDPSMTGSAGIGADALGASSGAFSSSGVYGGGMGGSGGSAGGSGGGEWVPPTAKQVREAEDRVTDATNSLDLKQKRLDEYLAKQAAGDKVSATTIEAARDAVEKQSRELDQATGDLEEVKRGKYKESKNRDGSSKDDSGPGGSEFKEVGKMIFGGLMESIGLDGSLLDNPFEWPTVKSAMAGLNFGLNLLKPKEGPNGEPVEDLSAYGGTPMGGDGGGGGMIDGLGGMLSNIGDPNAAQIAPAHGDLAMAGMTPGPGNGPVFDMRGSNLGVSPAVFEDKMGEMTAANRRHPNLPK